MSLQITYWEFIDNGFYLRWKAMSCWPVGLERMTLEKARQFRRDFEGSALEQVIEHVGQHAAKNLILASDIMIWLDEMCQSRYVVHDNHVAFESQDDAALYKLTFGVK